MSNGSGQSYTGDQPLLHGFTFLWFLSFVYQFGSSSNPTPHVTAMQVFVAVPWNYVNLTTHVGDNWNRNHGSWHWSNIFSITHTHTLQLKRGNFWFAVRQAFHSFILSLACADLACTFPNDYNSSPLHRWQIRAHASIKHVSVLKNSFVTKCEAFAKVAYGEVSY